ncbi:hypothetical protein BLNAU_8709 [Blattamonas nauphoetae]|uniref:Uncharacterized protein n=1 Tax=Blattamonas nauphoetae TaxID=2049346 RepID=A0ABQ9XXW6_9EUKA|nr:hypothetical protein BLNAU_8709 [Blattamonas nauphoetae]
MTSDQSIVNDNLSLSALNSPPNWNLSNISSLLEMLQCDDEDIVVDTLCTLQKVASESLFFEPAIVDSLFLREKNFIFSTFDKIGKSSPSTAVVTTLARVSLHPELEIAFISLVSLCSVLERNLTALNLLPSPIFPLSSPHQLYSGLSFLAALAMKLRIVFSKLLTNLPKNPSHIPKYAQLTRDDPLFITRSLDFCSKSFDLTLPLIQKSQKTQADLKTIRDLILFVKEALTKILATISTVDALIASIPSDSSPTTPLVSNGDTQIENSLKVLRNECTVFVSHGWGFFVNLTFRIAEPHKFSFQTALLDDPSFPDLVQNSLQLHHEGIRGNTITAILNVVIDFPSKREELMKANLVWRMFETVDFVRLPLSESETLLHLVDFIFYMFDPLTDDETERFKRYALIRDSVFEPAEPFINFIFQNSDKLILDYEDKTTLQNRLRSIRQHIKNMELRSDEHVPDVVSELVVGSQITNV